MLTNLKGGKKSADQSKRRKEIGWPISKEERNLPTQSQSRNKISWPIRKEERNQLNNHIRGINLLTNHKRGSKSADQSQKRIKISWPIRKTEQDWPGAACVLNSINYKCSPSIFPVFAMGKLSKGRKVLPLKVWNV